MHQEQRGSKKSKGFGKKQIRTESTKLPGKLADCSSNEGELCGNLYRRGDSAGGSAKDGRGQSSSGNSSALGKKCNVEKARLDKVYEMKSLPVVTALGTGIGEDFRYQ